MLFAYLFRKDVANVKKHSAWGPKLKFKYLSLLPIVLLFLVLSGCGYHNPYVYNGPEKSVYFATWKNRTNELQLNFKLRQSLIKSFQRIESIKIVQDKSEADLIVGGEILSISLPSLTYKNNRTRDVNIRLRYSYIVKDLTNDKILLKRTNKLKTEGYNSMGNPSATAYKENEALETILDEISMEIYQYTLSKLPNM